MKTTPIRKYRKRTGLNSSQFAESCKVSRQMMHYYETGKVEFSIKTARKFKQVLAKNNVFVEDISRLYP